MPYTSEEKKAAGILFAIAALEGAWCIVNWRINPQRFAAWLGLTHPGATPAAWALAALVTVIFCWSAARRLPSVRANLLAPSVLKLLALAVAIAAGVCEEAAFRKLLMDALRHAGHGIGVQIALSALAFGLVHGVWGMIRGSVVAAAGAIAATGALGGALAVVYVVAGRNVLPCIAAHLVINALVEPGLVLAAARGEMSRLARPGAATAPA